jgi:cytochrome c553
MTIKTTIGLMILVLAVGLAPAAFAKGDAARGQQKAKVCEACHGVDGQAKGFPQYPRLAGQHADYITHSLRAYKSGDRTNPIMGGIVSTLSDQDMEDLAAWFSSLEGLKDLSGS